MSKTQVRETERFVATGSSGTKYEVVEFTTFIGTTTIHTDQQQWAPGLKAYRLSTGQPLNRLPGGEFQIVVTGETLVASNVGAAA